MKILEKIKKFIGLENINAISREDVERFFDYESLSDYIYPIAYDKKNNVFINADNTIGFGFIVAVKPSIGRETYNLLENSIYQDPQIPANSIIQWILWCGNFVDPLLDAYLSLKNNVDPSVKKIAERFTEFVKEKTDDKISEVWEIPIRNAISILTVKIPFKIDIKDYENKIEPITNLRLNFYSTLEQAGLSPQSMSIDEYVIYTRLLLNPSHSIKENVVEHYKNTPLRKQVIHRNTVVEQHIEGNFLKIDGKYGKILTVKKYPKTFTANDVNEWLGSTQHKNRNQINTDFIVGFTARKLPETEVMTLRNKMEVIIKQKSASVLTQRLEERHDDAILFSRELEKGQVVWKGIFSYFLYDKDKKRVLDAVRVLKNMVKMGNLDLQEEIVPLPFFLSMIPFNTITELTKPAIRRAFTMFSYNAAHLTPLQFDWVGSGTPVIPLISRRGQLAFVDLWDTNGGMNACIVAPMGQGKSMFANHIIFNYRLLPNTKIRVVDVGESYKGIAKLFKGNFIKPTHDNPVRINPFSHIKNIDKDMDFLTNIVDTMIKPREHCNDTERSMISTAIRKSYEKYGNELVIDAVRDEILNIASQNKDYEFQKLASFNLAPWCEGGQYSKFMHGKSEIDLDNRLVVFELGGIKDDTTLTNVVLLSAFFFINDEIYRGNRNIKKIVIWDEAWRFANNEAVLGFIEGGAREYRKFNGSLIFITQGISDLLKNSVTKTLKNNSEYLFLFSQPPEEWERILNDKDIYLTEAEKNIYRDTIRTVKGRYSEMLVISRSMGRGILRLVLPAEIYWVYTTSAQEVALREKFLKETGDIYTAIKKCIEYTQNTKN